MPILTYSQNYYPQTIVLNNDTLVLIKPSQLIRANVLMMEGQRDKAIVINLRSQLLTSSELLKIKQDSEMLLNKKCRKLEQKLIAVDKLTEHNKAIALRKAKQDKKKMFLIGGAVGAIAVLVVGLLI